MGNKGWQELKENWCEAMSESNNDLGNTTSNTVPNLNPDQEFSNIFGKKKKTCFNRI